MELLLNFLPFLKYKKYTNKKTKQKKNKIQKKPKPNSVFGEANIIEEIFVDKEAHGPNPVCSDVNNWQLYVQSMRGSMGWV